VYSYYRYERPVLVSELERRKEGKGRPPPPPPHFDSVENMDIEKLSVGWSVRTAWCR